MRCAGVLAYGVQRVNNVSSLPCGGVVRHLTWDVNHSFLIEAVATSPCVMIAVWFGYGLGRVGSL